jgi:L-lactate dehydrogenase complex protein LldG
MEQAPMNDARADIMQRIQSKLRGGPVPEATAAALADRLKAHPRSLVPARAKDLDRAARTQLFIAMAEEVAATVVRVARAEEAPAAVARYLAERNLPASLVLTPDPRVMELPWSQTALALRAGVAHESDTAGVSGCFAAIAETGTLMVISGPDRPTRNSFLPETHIVLLRAEDIAGYYEEAWDRLRAARWTGSGMAMPRTVNFITGPSRTGDIAQKLELGAHGPRRLHIVLIDDAATG